MLRRDDPASTAGAPASTASRSAYAVGLLMALYVVLIGATCLRKYARFEYDDFDLAVHTQSLAAILRGQTDSSILGIPFLGNHMVLMLYALAPLYAVFPYATLLILVQTVVLAAGAWAVYRLARQELSPAWGLGLAAAYLVYPPLIHLNLYEFHPIALTGTCILFAFLFWRQNRFAGFLLMLLAALSCQENIALLAVGFGVFAVVERKRWWWSVVPLTVGTVYFVTVVMFVMPRLNDTVNFQSLYSHLGDSLPEVAVTIVRHPIQTLKLMTQPAKLSFLKDLFAPLGFLSLLSPLTWIPAAPILLQRLLSNRPTESVIIFHYQAEFIPFVFVSAIVAIRRFRRLPFRVLHILPAVLAAGFATLALSMGGVPVLMRYHWSAPAGGAALVAAKRACVEAVPPTARVATTFEFLAPLAHLDELHSLHHINAGHYTLSQKPYPLPATLDLIVIDTNDRMTFSPRCFYRPTTFLNLQALLGTGTWALDRQAESLLVLRRAGQIDPRLPLARVVAAIPESASERVTQREHTGFTLRAFAAHPEGDGIYSVLDLFWETSTEPPLDADMLLTVTVEGSGAPAVYEAILSPGSRFWPPQSWPPAVIVRDRQRIPLHVRTSAAAVDVTMLPMTWHRGL